MYHVLKERLDAGDVVQMSEYVELPVGTRVLTYLVDQNGNTTGEIAVFTLLDKSALQLSPDTKAQFVAYRKGE